MTLIPVVSVVSGKVPSKATKTSQKEDKHLGGQMILHVVYHVARCQYQIQPKIRSAVEVMLFDVTIVICQG